MLKQMKFLLMVALLVYAAIANAQVTTASMSGRVTDKAGEAVIGATVLAIHEPSGTRYGTVTNVDGYYNIQGMRVGGPYKVDISYIGYQKSVFTDVVLRLGENFVLNASLKESSELLDEVVITAEQSIAKTGVSTNVTERQITSLPTITRSITDFTKLSPYAGSNNSFAGRDGRYNFITIDGAAFNNGFGLNSNNLPGGDAQPIALDAIEEISVNVSPFDVKYSNFTGASVNAVTKSGTNSFNGTLYTFQKPKGFNGNTIEGSEISGWDDKSTQTYGLTFGGPIIKNKLFFFVSAEIEKSIMPGVLWKPSDEENATGDAKTYTSRTWRKDLDRVKDFVMKTPGYEYDPGVYENFGNFNSDNYKILARIDWNINNDHKFTARFNYVDSKNDAMLSPTSTVITRTNPDRYGYSSIAFSNSNFAYHDVVSSASAELNSRFSNNIQNKLIATFTHIQNTRSYSGDPFPYIDIYKDGNQYMTLGTEVFTPHNDVINNVFNVTDNVNITLGKHYLTAGLSFERQYFKNQYLRGPLGYYRYASVDDFVNEKQPMFYGLTYGYNNTEAPGADLAFGMGGIYAQDDWSVTPNFRLSYGLRLDIPMYLNSLAGNDAILKEEFANGEKVDVSKWPKTQVLFSPRVGFNWDIMGDRSIVVSGGTGMFTGLLPFVWFTNQPTGAGMIQNMLEIGNSGAAIAPFPADFKFNKDYKEIVAQYSDLFPSTPASVLPGSIAFVDRDFKMPQVWRSNVNVDIKLPADFQLSVGGMYTRDVFSVLQKNINESAPTGEYAEQPGRVYWKDNRVNANTGTVIKLTNGDEKGYQYSFNALLSKRFSHNVSGMVGYTYTVAKDLTANPGSSAASSWQNNVAVNSLNEEVLANSLFATPHRVIGNFIYEVSLSKNSKSSFSLFYSGFHQGRYSYVYTSDLNGDGNKSDLIYVNNSLEEMIPLFDDMKDKAGNVTYSGKDQATDFWNYVNGEDSYLKGRKGKYVERNGSLMPWLNRFDFKVAQDFYAFIGKRKYGIQISFDILNVGNLFNDAWGSYKTCGLKSYDNLQILKTTNKVGEPIRYQVNATSHDNWMSKSEWYNTTNVSNAWSMQIGVKLTF